MPLFSLFKRFIACLLLAANCCAAWAQAPQAPQAPQTTQATQATQGYYRMPSIHDASVWFTAEGDIWRVSTAGGVAVRVTTHPGTEQMSAPSPDGQWLAFVGAYEGSPDAYVMPVAGGTPKRLSFEGILVRVIGWTPQGEVLITSLRAAGLPDAQLVAINPQTMARRVLPVAQANDGALSRDGKTLYFTRSGLRGDNVRSYRGGAMARLWKLDLSGTAEATPFIASSGNERRPMVYADGAGERVAFISDRDGTHNIWSANAAGGDLKQHTRHSAFEVRYASNSGKSVAYAYKADIHLLDLSSNADRTLPISLSGDFDHQRQRWLKTSATPLTAAALSANGERAVLTLRGRVVTAGVGSLRRAELDIAPDARCRNAVASYDSKTVFALCDTSGELEVWQFAANGDSSLTRQLTTGSKGLRLEIVPSPDGKYLAHTDNSGALHLTALNAANKERPVTRTIDRSLYGSYETLAWSPDSRALAIVRADSAVGREQLLLHTLADSKTTALTTDRYDNAAPAFTPDGKWLYFLSDRSFTVLNPFGPWGDRNMGPYFDKRTKVYALALQAGLRFPFQAKDELESAKDDVKKAVVAAPSTITATASVATGDATTAVTATTTAVAPAPATSAPKAPSIAAIQLNGLAARLYEVPLPAGNYSRLETDGKRLYLLEAETTPARKLNLRTLAIDNNATPPEVFASDIKSYELSGDGKKLLITRGGTANIGSEVLIVDAGAKMATDVSKNGVRWADWALAIDPKSEWQQMFTDAWRMHRDYFWDKTMRGLDWPAVRAKYAPLVPRITDRAELNEVLGQMIGELSTLHSQVATPDLRAGPDDIAIGALGARFTKVADGFRIDHIYASEAELPELAAPLATQTVNAQVGDIITHVNSRPSASAFDMSELLRGQVGKQVLLTLKTVKASRQVIVLPTSARGELNMRLADWEHGRAEQVRAASAGRIGYLHLRAMGRSDIETFAREFYAHIDREGLIIDVRNNGGGNIDSWIIEKLLRRVWTHWQRRAPEGSPPYGNMQQTFTGHLTVLIDENTYSDGETFAEGVKRLKLGALVGKRTQGAGIWLSDRNRLSDGGIARVAETGQFASGLWLIEGVGVVPDIEVDNLPRATFNGRDAQLEAAISHLQKRMAEQPAPVPRPPAYGK